MYTNALKMSVIIETTYPKSEIIRVTITFV